MKAIEKQIKILKNMCAVHGTTAALIRSDELLENTLKEIRAAEWTKVRDGLPTNDRWLRVRINRQFDIGNFEGHAQYSKGGHYWRDREGNIILVTHWSEITKPEEG